MNGYIKIITEDSFEAWFLNRYEQETINRMAAYGVEGVCGELTYYSNTSQLFERFHTEILQMVARYSESSLDTNLLVALAGGNTISSPALFTTNLVQTAAAYLSHRYQRDEGDQTAELNGYNEG